MMDQRSRLTWRGIFTNWGNTAVYNFYTPGEDVVANIAHEDGNLFDVGGFAWGCQEKLKGRMADNYLVGSAYAGWGFNTNEYGNYDWGYWKREQPAEAQNISINNLRNMPFYLDEPYGLFNPNEDDAKVFAQNHYYWLLAQAIPARTFGIAANPVTEFTSLNMQATFADEWPRAEPDWRHSDLKSMAYMFTHRMFEMMVVLGGVK